MTDNLSPIEQTSLTSRNLITAVKRNIVDLMLTIQRETRVPTSAQWDRMVSALRIQLSLTLSLSPPCVLFQVLS